MFILTIPGRAVPKGRPRFSRTGGVYNPKTTNDYERHVANCWYDKYGTTALEGRLEVTIMVGTDRDEKQDVDNLAKSILDGLQKGGAFAQGDQQVYKLVITKTHISDKNDLAAIVRLEAYTPYNGDD